MAGFSFLILILSFKSRVYISKVSDSVLHISHWELSKAQENLKNFKFNVILYLELVKISKYSINTSDSDF